MGNALRIMGILFHENYQDFYENLNFRKVSIIYQPLSTSSITCRSTVTTNNHERRTLKLVKIGPEHLQTTKLKTLPNLSVHNPRVLQVVSRQDSSIIVNEL